MLWSVISIYYLTLFHPGGGRICPPTTYFVVKRLKHIERPCNFLTFPWFQTDLLGVPLSGPLENVDIYFSKIDIEIFPSDTIFLVIWTLCLCVCRRNKQSYPWMQCIQVKLGVYSNLPSPPNQSNPTNLSSQKRRKNVLKIMNELFEKLKKKL